MSVIMPSLREIGSYASEDQENKSALKFIRTDRQFCEKMNVKVLLFRAPVCLNEDRAEFGQEI